MRRGVLACVALLGLAATALPAAAACPGVAGRTVRFVVPNAPGGGYDTIARLLEPHLETALGSELVIDNIPEAGGIVGARTIRDADPDGLTLGLLNGRVVTFAAITGRPGDPRLDELEVLAQVDADTQVFMVAPDSAIGTVDDLWNGSLGHPVAFASTTNLVSTLGIASLLDFPIAFVPIDGTTEQNLALLRGDVDLISRSTDTAAALLRGGEMRALLRVTAGNGTADPALAGVPGLEDIAVRRAAELGRPEAEARARAAMAAELGTSRRLLVAPKGLPPERLACIRDAVAAVLADPAVIAEALARGRTLAVTGPEALAPVLEGIAAAEPWLRELAAEAARRQGG